MKFAVLLLVFAAVIGFGVFMLNSQPGKTPIMGDEYLPPAQEPRKLEITERIARNIIASVRGSNFDTSAATYATASLGLEGIPVLIIGTTEPLTDFSEHQSKAAIVIVHILKEVEGYEEIGRVQYEEFLREAPELLESEDLTGDGVQELFMSLGYGGASNATYGFLRVDMQGKKVEWVQIRDPSGQTRNATFLVGGTVTHTETVQTIDLNLDDRKEIVELFTQLWEPSGQEDSIPSEKRGETWCLARAYRWSGSLFDFDRTLSEQFLANLGPGCAI